MKKKNAKKLITIGILLPIIAIVSMIISLMATEPGPALAGLGLGLIFLMLIIPISFVLGIILVSVGVTKLQYRNKNTNKQTWKGKLSFKQAWKGKLSLGKAFWLIYVLFGFILNVIIAAIYVITTGIPFHSLMKSNYQFIHYIAALPYTLFALVCVWRCAVNSNEFWEYASRIFVIFALIITLIEIFRHI